MAKRTRKVSPGDCLGLLEDYAEKAKMGKIPKEKLQAIIDEVEAFREQALKTNRTLTNAQLTETQILQKQLKYQKIKRRRALELERQRKANQFVKKFKNAKEGVKSLLGGESKELIEGSGEGSYQIFHATEQHYHNMVLGELADRGLIKTAFSGTMDREIFMALSEMHPKGKLAGNAGAKAMPDIPEDAIEIARIIKTFNDSTHEDLGRFVDLGYLPDYMTRRFWDAQRIADPLADDLGKAKFISFMKKELDIDRTFPGMTDAEIDASLSGAFDNIIEGKHNSVNDNLKNVTDEILVFSPRRAVGNKLTAQRSWHFKDGEAFYRANAEYGRRNLMDSVMASINFNARSVGLMSTLGPNPEAALRRLATEHNLLDGKGNIDPQIQALYDEISGRNLLGGDSSMARWTKNITQFQNLTKMAFSGISALTDNAFGVGQRTQRGRQNIFSALGSQTFEFLQTITNKADRRAIMKQLELFYDDFGILFHNRYQSASNEFGASHNRQTWLDKAEHLMFKVNGLTMFTHSAKLLAARTASRILAGHSKVKWAKLPAHVQGHLKVYGFTDQMWEKIRKGVAKDTHGADILDMQAIRDANPNDPDINLAVNKFRAYLVDQSETYSPSPGARTSAATNRGYARDTIEGATMRVATQYMSFPLSVMASTRRALKFEADGGATTALGVFKNREYEHIAGLAGTLTTATFFGFMALQMKAGLKGQSFMTPDSDNWAEIMRRSFIQGGAGGLYVDVLLGDWQHYGADPSRSFIGPTFGDAAGIARPFAKGIRGDFKGAGKDALKFLERNTPGMNYPFVKPLLNWSLLNQWRDPEYTDRINKRLEKTGQSLLLPHRLGD